LLWLGSMKEKGEAKVKEKAYPNCEEMPSLFHESVKGHGNQKRLTPTKFLLTVATTK